MKRVTLPGGGWADLREPSGSDEPIDKLTVKGRRGINVVSGRLSQEGRARIVAIQNMDAGPDRDAAVNALDSALSEDDLEAFFRIQEATLVALLIDWSLDRALPTTHTVGDMPVDVYDALVAEVATEAAAATSLDLDLSVGDGTPDPKERSGGSGNSGGPSTGSGAPTPTLT